MVKSFHFSPTPTLMFGIGKRKELQQLIRKFGIRPILITGSGTFSKTNLGIGLLHDIEGAFKFCPFASVSREPTPEDIDFISAKYRQEKPDVIIAIGGGSVIDAGKAISAMINTSGSITDYLEGVGTKQPDGQKIPFIAVPTTAGTGSETTKNAVISQIGKDGFKKSIRHDNFVPNYAVVDPELTLSCSREITASSGLDAFTQLLESYVSSKSSPLIDSLAFEGIRTVVRSLKAAWDDGSNLDARTGMSYAAMLSGIALANAGLGTVHGFASSVGGLFPIPHGVVCGTLMAEVVAINIERMKTNEEAYIKYASVGRLLTKKDNETDEYYCKFLVDTLRVWTEELKIDKLSSFGVKREDISQIVSITENKNNPVLLSLEDMSLVLEKRL